MLNIQIMKNRISDELKMESEEKIKRKESRLGRLLVKGYMRPDGTSYTIVIPKKVREALDLKGGEYFLMRVNTHRGKIKLNLVEISEEEPE